MMIMRICMIGGLKYCNGGVERYTRNLKKELERRGLEVKLYEFNASNDSPVFSPIQFLPEMRRELGGKGADFDIIHSHNYYPVIFAKGKKNYITTAHYSYLEYADAAGLRGARKFASYAIGKTYESANFNCAEKIAAVSEYLKERLVGLYGIGPEKIEVIRPGVYLERINVALASAPAGKDGDKTRLLFVGRLFRQKGLETLIRAMKLLGRRDIELLIAGDGAYMEPLKKLAAGLGLGNVRFLGFVKEEEKYALMRDCELVVFPSLFEAFPAVALEAMACGAAIIASDIPSFREALDDTAVYFTKGDEKDLAGKIERTLQEGRLRSRLGRAAVERSKNYDFSFGIGKYVELYKSIME